MIEMPVRSLEVPVVRESVLRCWVPVAAYRFLRESSFMWELVPGQERKLYCVVGYLLLLAAWFVIAHLSGVWAPRQEEKRYCVVVYLCVSADFALRCHVPVCVRLLSNSALVAQT